MRSNQANTEVRRKMKYKLKKLTIGVVSCLVGSTVFYSSGIGIYAADQPANTEENTYVVKEDGPTKGQTFTEYNGLLTGEDIINATYTLTTPTLAKNVCWINFTDPDAEVTNLLPSSTGNTYGTLQVGTTWKKQISEGFYLYAEVTNLQPFESTDIYYNRVKDDASVSWTYDPNKSNYRFDASAPFTSTGDAPVELMAKDTNYLTWNGFEDSSTDGSGYRFGSNYQYSSVGITFDVYAIVDGVKYPVDIVLADGEQLTENEFVTYVTNGDNWRILTEANGDGSLMWSTSLVNDGNDRTSKTVTDGVVWVDASRRWFPVTASNLQGNNANHVFDGDYYKGFTTESGIENAGLGSQVFGPYATFDKGEWERKDEARALGTIPFVESTNTTEFSFYTKGSGKQNTIVGIIISDKGDAPSTYGTAQHLILSTNALTNDSTKNQQPQLGTIGADYDRTGTNALTGQGVDTIDTTADKLPWFYDDNNAVQQVINEENQTLALDEGETQLTAESNGLYTFFMADSSTNYLNIKASSNGSSTAYVRGWIDYNGNGVFDDGEASDIVEVNGDNQTVKLAFSNISDAADLDQYGARVRISTVKSEIENPTGLASNGEVEDFLVRRIERPHGEYDETEGLQGETQTATLVPTAYGKKAAAANAGTTADNTIDQNVNAYIVNPDTGENLGQSYTEAGEGTYTIKNTSDGIVVTFTPEANFTGTAKGIAIRSTDTNGMTTGWTNEDADSNVNQETTTKTMDSYYVPTVNPLTKVVVKYVDEDGNELASEVVDAEKLKAGDSYDTTDNKPMTIVKDGVEYSFKEIKEDSAEEVATLTEEQLEQLAANRETGEDDFLTVTYVYSPTVYYGDVVINYVDEDGNTLKDSVKQVDHEETGTDYAVVDENKPQTITTDDGKVYTLVKVEGDESGKVVEDTTEITYVYKEVKSGVTVKYQDIDSKADIADSVADTEDASVGTDYDTTDQKKDTITTDDGTVYYLVEKDPDSDDETGKVETDGKTVIYLYEKGGSVVVDYVDEEGNSLLDQVVDTDQAKDGTEYDTSDNLPETITKDGLLYKLKVSDDGTAALGDNSADPTGAVKSGETKDVIYVYEKVTGDVVVKYRTTDGTEIKDPITIEDDTQVGTSYAVGSDDKPDTITTADGKVYKKVAVEGNETGSVVEGTTTITYVYEEVTYDVDVNYVDSETGDPIAKPVKDTDEGSVGTAYDTDTDHKPEKIITADGTVYYYEATDTENGDDPTGTLTDKDINVIYTYKPAGNVVVKYVLDGTTTEIKDPVTDTDNAKEGTAYDTTDNKPATIVKDGITYDLVKVQDGDKESGKVKSGDITVVTYIYKEHVDEGDVVAKYVDINGNELAEPATIQDTTEVGTDYTVEEKDKPQTITTSDGKVYELIRVDGNEEGKVVAGTTTITYIYKEVVSDINVAYVNTDNEKISATVKDTDDASVGTDYDTSDKKLEKIITPDGTVYYYKETKADTPETGKVTADEQTVTYVYEKAGSVKVLYKTDDGTEIKTPVMDETDVKDGTEYDTTDNKPETIVYNGVTYVLTATDGKETGNVKAGTTTEVTYIYKALETSWVDKDGNPLKDPEDGTKPDEEGDDIPGYTLVEIKTDEDGNTINVYEKTPEKTPETKWVDTDDKALKDPEEGSLPDEEGDDIDGYTLVKIITDQDGNVTNVYKKNPEEVTPETKWVDTDGNELKDPEEGSLPDEEGDDIEGYTLVKIITDKDGNVTNVYKKNPEEVTPETKWVDTDGNELKDPEEGSLPDEEGDDIEGYTLVKIITDEDGNVTNVYKKNPEEVTPETKWVDTDGNELKDPEDGSLPDEEGDDIDGYTLVKIITDQDGNVTNVYKKNPEEVTPETKWVDTDGNELKDPEEGSLPDEEGDDIDGYTLVKIITDQDGNVTNVYKKNPEEVKPETKWVDTDGNELKDPEEGSLPDEEGDDIDGYTLVKIITDKDGNVTNVYKKNPEEVKPETKWVDTDGNELKDPEDGSLPDEEGDDIPGYTLVKITTDKDGNVVNVYEKNPEPETKWVDTDGNPLKDPEDGTKPDEEGDDIPGYTIVKITTDQDGNVVNVYEQTPTPATKWVDTDGNPLKDPEDGTKPDDEGDDIPGYTLVKITTDQDGNVVNVYEKTPTPATKWVDTDGNPLKDPEDGSLPDEEGDDIPGYTLVRIVTDSKGNVTNIYEKIPNNPTTEWVDTDGNTLKDPEDGTKPDEEGDDIPNYKIVEITTDEDGNVINKYEAVKGNVIVNFVDTEGNKLAETVTTDPEKVGNSYATAPQMIDGYYLSVVPGNASGTIVEGTTEVTYVYTKIPTPVTEGEVITYYVDTEGNPISSVELQTSLPVGDNYTTTQKEIEGYIIKTVPDNATGTVIDGTISVTYVYEKIQTTWVDTDDNTLKTPETGSKPDEEGDDVPGYSLVKIITDDKGNVINVYEKTPEPAPETKWVDTDGNELKTPEDGSLPDEEGDDVPGYTIVKITTDKDGNVTNVYEKTPEPETKWVDKDGNPLKDPEDGTKPDEEGDDVPGYTLIKITTDKDGNVVNVYEKTPEPETKWVDKDGNPLKDPEDGTKPDEEGDDIPGYTLVKITTDKDGNVVNIYEKTPAPVTTWVDKDGNPLKDPEDGSKPDEEGDDVPGYTLIKVTTDEDGNVVNIYEKTPTPVTTWVDKDGNPLKDPEDGSNPDEEGDDVPGYTLIKVTTDEDGNVVNTYEKNPAPVTTWVDKDGNPLKDPEDGTKPDTEGDDVPGYTLVKVTTDEDGNVVNTYEKNPTPQTKWVDKDGNDIKDPEDGSKPDEEGDDVPGYTLVKVTTDKDGNVVNIYEKNPAPVTTWVDKDGNTIKDPEDGTKPDEEGDDVPGYTLIKTTTDKDGNVVNTYIKTPVTKWIDKDGNPLKDPEDGNKPDIEGDDIPGYYRITVTTDEDGNTINTYDKIVPNHTTWVDEDGNKLKDEAEGAMPDEEGDDMPGYTLVEIDKEEDGDIVNVYHKIVTNWTDENGKPLKPAEDGAKPDEEGDDVDGYVLVKTETDKNGNVNNIYKAVKTSWVTEDGTTLRPDEAGSKPDKEGDDIQGYTIVSSTTDEDGNVINTYKLTETAAPGDVINNITNISSTAGGSNTSSSTATKASSTKTGVNSAAGEAAGLGLISALAAIVLGKRRKKHED
jgi:surface repeat SSSPR-51 protein